MQKNRSITKAELQYVKQLHKSSKKTMFWLIIIFAAVIGFAAITVYSKEESNNIFINVLFGFFIMILGIVNWIYKGYKKNKINPIVYASTGFYKRIHEQHGKNGKYFDTFNGSKVKLPWHWRKHLKTIDNEVTYEYIVSDGMVGMNEISILVISADKLSLDYELNNGLTKAKPISIFNILSIILIIPTFILASFGDNFIEALQFPELFKTHETHAIILKTPEALNTISKPNFITIENAWVYQFKREGTYNSGNFIISKTERDRIYKHPNANYNHSYYSPSKYLIKPKRENILNALKSNPFSRRRILRITDTAALNKIIENEYKKSLSDYNARFKHSKLGDSILEILKPKKTILEISQEDFNAPKTPFKSLKKNLEHTFTVKGFYIPEENKIISKISLDYRRLNIERSSILIGISLIMMLLVCYSTFKIVRNSRLKMRLVKKQLSHNSSKRLS